jgi:uncharacterized membrane protein YwaF
MGSLMNGNWCVFPYRPVLRGLSDTVIFFIRKDTSTGNTITVLRPDLYQIMDVKTILLKQPFFISHGLQVISETICHPIGNKKAGFSHIKIGCS